MHLVSLYACSCDAVMVASALLYNPYLFDGEEGSADYRGFPECSGYSAYGLSPTEYNPVLAA